MFYSQINCVGQECECGNVFHFWRTDTQTDRHAHTLLMQNLNELSTVILQGYTYTVSAMKTCFGEFSVGISLLIEMKERKTPHKEIFHQII